MEHLAEVCVYDLYLCTVNSDTKGTHHVPIHVFFFLIINVLIDPYTGYRDCLLLCALLLANVVSPGSRKYSNAFVTNYLFAVVCLFLFFFSNLFIKNGNLFQMDALCRSGSYSNNREPVPFRF